MKDLLLKYKTLIILVSISLIVFFIVNFVILKDDSPKPRTNTKTTSDTETITPNTTNPNNTPSTSTSNPNGNNGSSTIVNVNNKIWGNGDKDDNSYVIDKEDLDIFKSNNILKEYKKDPFSINVVDKDKFLNGFYYPNEIQESPSTTDNNANTNTDTDTDTDTKSNTTTTGTNTNNSKTTTSNSDLTPAKVTTPTTTTK